ncbi:MAG: bifunctional serine/threonine-protein kinase/formylglycine-generating enzyme family protein [Myxococcota bacterium]
MSDQFLRGQLLQLVDLHGLSAECRDDLLDLLESPMSSGDGASWMGDEDTYNIDLMDDAPTELGLPAPAQRYAFLELLGEGGMGEVHRVFDRHLNRTMAMKVLKKSLLRSPRARARFVAEARITAQLQHPGIVPVHDVGELDTSQPYYTMREVQGQTLRAAIDAVHAVSQSERWGETAARGDRPGWTLRRLLGALRRTCEAMAYAHSRGVVHRDIKPDNIMVGAFGEVLVMDWGIAMVLDQSAPRFAASPITGVDDKRARFTGVVGTPAYMSFEQATGEPARIGPHSDVYSLGATMYRILSGEAPFRGDAQEIRRRLLTGQPLPPRHRGGPPIPEELEEACMRAMAREPADRFPSPAGLADAITAWLEGAQRRDRALEVVARADRLHPEIDHLRGRVRELRADSERLLSNVRPHDPEQKKRPGWKKQDEADALAREADLKTLQYRETLRTALHYVRDLGEARDRLADHYAARHAAAEARRDAREAEIQERMLRAHDSGRYAPYLRGEGAMTLYTDPPGARVRLYRYETQYRRMVPVYQRSLGYTPLITVRLPIGSYVLKIQHPNCAEVSYPVQITRQEHWSGAPPGEREPKAIYLPRRGELRASDCYIPAGWFRSGGDPDAGHALPPRKVWCDALVIRRFPVTNAEYIAFLDDLVARGQEELALRYAPRERPTPNDPEGGLLYGRSSLGRFLLVPDAHGDVWLQDMPVIMMPWAGVVAYCRWLSRQEGLPWRLPGELEWEKSARGVDGRRYPWGDNFDPSWACTRESHMGRSQPVAVDSFPVDESPYGVRGMAGNARDWCGDVYSPRGPRLEGNQVVPPILPMRADLSAGHTGITRGGAWWYSPQAARVTYRAVYLPSIRFHPLTFRIARTFPNPS